MGVGFPGESRARQVRCLFRLLQLRTERRAALDRRPGRRPWAWLKADLSRRLERLSRRGWPRRQWRAADRLRCLRPDSARLRLALAHPLDDHLVDPHARRALGFGLRKTGGGLGFHRRRFRRGDVRRLRIAGGAARQFCHRCTNPRAGASYSSKAGGRLGLAN